ncbi:hypothetical protein HYX10_06500 [Candidatus Woesearchaeota archaeon]|nr:hypothetical protein [Candidatus Woesearchaeota archaeon]
MYILILNLGLKSVRSVVFDEAGRAIAKHWLPVKTFIDGQVVEQDADEWFDQAKLVIAALDSEIRKQITHISVTSSSSCLVMLDSNGAVAHNVIMVSDKRSIQQARTLRKDFAYLFANQNHLAEPNYMFPKIMWLKENKPGVFAKIAKFMASDDFLIYRLTGQFVTDYLNAEKFYFDNETKSYPRQLLKHLNLTEDVLPRVVGIGTAAGPVREELKQELGLGDVEVIVSTYDAICAFWGAGAVEEGEVSHVCGTCSSFRVYSAIKTPPGSGILAQPFSNPKMHIVGGSNNIEGGIIEWAKDCFYGDSYPIRDNLIYEIMENEARASSLGARGLIFLPYLLGERVPVADPHVRGMFFGLERIHNRKDIMRSIFEAAGFNTLHMLRAVEAKGVKVNRIRISGGLARIDYICKLKADISGKEVAVLEEFETTSLGAFMIAAVAAGIFPDLKSAAAVAKIKKIIQPDMEAHQKYLKLYDLFTHLYRQTADIFQRRTQTMSELKESYSAVTNL